MWNTAQNPWYYFLYETQGFPFSCCGYEYFMAHAEDVVKQRVSLSGLRHLTHTYKGPSVRDRETETDSFLSLKRDLKMPNDGKQEGCKRTASEKFVLSFVWVVTWTHFSAGNRFSPRPLHISTLSVANCNAILLPKLYVGGRRENGSRLFWKKEISHLFQPSFLMCLSTQDDLKIACAGR
jgi:hypothetical protein